MIDTTSLGAKHASYFWRYTKEGVGVPEQRVPLCQCCLGTEKMIAQKTHDLIG